MPYLGLIRTVGHEGKVTLPRAIRDQLGIGDGTQLEFLLDGDRIVLRPYHPGCARCGGVVPNIVHVTTGVYLCGTCVAQLYREATR